MRKLLCLLVIVSIFSNFTMADEKKEKHVIQISILLDTSNSMDGLINQAKGQLWKIVNELATTKKGGQIPELQVALYEYGKSSLPGGEGYLRMVLGLSTDLDKVSEVLFALTTNGGSEYCGWVIQSATKELTWSNNNKDYKAIFIAGNEPFTQGPVDFRQACRDAIAKGIVVNTIHCGSHDAGINGMWRDAAMISDGSYLNIDQNQKIVDIKAPQDKALMKLNEKLNRTYVAVSAEGRESKERQMVQDANARKMSNTSNMQRVFAKSSGHYRPTWDLVESVNNGNCKLEEIKEKDLPQEMRKMTLEQKKAYVKKLEQERAALKTQIQKLKSEREKYKQAELKKLKASGEDTLDSAMIKTLRKQLQKKEYEVKK